MVCNHNISSQITFVIKTSNKTLPTLDYTKLVLHDQIFDQWVAPTIKVSKPNTFLTIYAKPFDFCFKNLN
jgi:hypothetical protein